MSEGVITGMAVVLYYQRSVEVYEQIAKIDPGHEGEAQYWAQRERLHARGIEVRIRVWISRVTTA